MPVGKAEHEIQNGNSPNWQHLPFAQDCCFHLIVDRLTN